MFYGEHSKPRHVPFNREAEGLIEPLPTATATQPLSPQARPWLPALQKERPEKGEGSSFNWGCSHVLCTYRACPGDTMNGRCHHRNPRSPGPWTQATMCHKAAEVGGTDCPGHCGMGSEQGSLLRMGTAERRIRALLQGPRELETAAPQPCCPQKSIPASNPCSEAIPCYIPGDSPPRLPCHTFGRDKVSHDFPDVFWKPRDLPERSG